MFDLLKSEPLIDVTQPGYARVINEKASVFDMMFIMDILKKFSKFFEYLIGNAMNMCPFVFEPTARTARTAAC
ncbi:hypothetical protein [Natronoarchaeum rubrum]|uniref:hypothetical protein n=1 Tax=Natronoarchaeum rubrum TaxID=755311 RepID=UPI002111E089|nr:hypothetical protein [Natronoarchaeum rubrum]